MLGSVLFIVNKLNEMSRLFLSRYMGDVISGDNLLIIAIGQAAYILGYIAFYRMYSQRVEGSARIALRLFCGGGIVLAIGHAAFTPIAPEEMFILVFIGLLGLLIGLIWFGIAALRQPILSRWQWLPLATGVMGTLGFVVFSGQEINATFLVFRTLFALGLFGLGLMLSLEKPAPRKTGLEGPVTA